VDGAFGEFDVASALGDDERMRAAASFSSFNFMTSSIFSPRMTG